MQARVSLRSYALPRYVLTFRRLRYLETVDLLYRVSALIFSGPDRLVQLSEKFSDATLQRISALELRTPALLTWQYNVKQPLDNRVSVNEWMSAIAVLKRMRNLQRLHIIVPNPHAPVAESQREDNAAIERDLLGRFADLDDLRIPDFVVWSASSDPMQRHGVLLQATVENEASHYTFSITRYSPWERWPPPKLRHGEEV